MLKKGIILILLSFAFLLSRAPKDKVYLFSFFIGNGEDGLHLDGTEQFLKLMKKYLVNFCICNN